MTDDHDSNASAPDSRPGDDNVVKVDFAARRARNSETQREIPIPKAQDLPVDPTAPQKLEAFSKLIELGMTMVTVDSRRPGVVVPPVHQGEIQLNLNFSLRFGIDDFHYDDDDVRASLSFGGVPHLCILPWSAVYMVRSHVTDDVAVFPNSLPPELHAAAAAEFERLQQEGDGEDQEETPASLEAIPMLKNADGDLAAKPGLSLSTPDAPEETPDASVASERLETPSERPRMGLRLVKSDDTE